MAQLTDFQSIPRIDLGGLRFGDTAVKAAVGRAIRAACIDVGFFYVSNHGVPAEVRARAFREAAAFFALPDAVKSEIHVTTSSKFRGFTGLYEERHDSTTSYYEPHEVLDFGRDIPADDPAYRAGQSLYGPNLWPRGRPAFRRAIEAYYDAMLDLSDVLLRGFALALELEEAFFLDKFDRAAGALRCLHYPATDQPADRFGVGAHTDYECFTILAQDGHGGLEVRNAAGAWIPAPPIADTFVINIGDLMARWTNDLFASTLHRAANRSRASRYSMPFFVGPNGDAEVAAIPSCVGPGNPAKHPPVLAGRHVQERLIELQQKLGREVAV
jgi:isopenicillin N synthase-like dioxygenase